MRKLLFVTLVIFSFIFISCSSNTPEDGSGGGNSGSNSYKIVYSADALYNNYYHYNQIFIADYNGANPVQLTFDKRSKTSPILTPNGKTIIFILNTSDEPDLYRGIYTMDLDGSNRKRIYKASDVLRYMSTNGEKILFHQEGDLYTVNLDGTNFQRVYSQYDTTAAVLSNTGDKIAFITTLNSNRVGEIYINKIGSSAITKLTTLDNCPRNLFFSEDDSKVIYTYDDKIYSVDIDTLQVEIISNTERYYSSIRYSPGFSKFIFVYNVYGNNTNLYGRMNPDGTGEELFN